MPINQLDVMDQRTGKNGQESCGYHAVKNALLGLMWTEGMIDNKMFQTLLKDSQLFRTIFNATEGKTDAFGSKDLTIIMLLEILEAVKQGKHDFFFQLWYTQAQNTVVETG